MSKKQKRTEKFLAAMTYGAFIFTFSVLVFIIAFILFKGVRT